MKRTLVTILALISTSISHAGDSIYYWGEVKPNQAATTTSTRIAVAEIGHNKGGNQALFFTIVKRPWASPVCDEVNDTPETSVAKFDGQAVQVYYWCRASSDNEDKYVQITPATHRGVAFVMGKFRRANQVQFSFGDVDVPLSAQGFVKAWNSAGGDAL